jgi:hypothetical protein
MAMEATISSTASARPGLPSVIVAATIGNVLEWFDFLVYGFFAVTIAEVFFPVGNPTVSLLITFGTFGLAYLVRPLGAIIVGTYSDRAGRKAGLTLSIGLMLIGTTLMVVTPGFATIGLAAPIIITVARLLQGFSVGGEFGSAVTFLVEHGGERRGYSASWQWATIGMTSIIASLFGLVLTSQLSHQQLVDWGWRVPYMFGLLVGPAGLYIRSRMAETPEFLNAEKRDLEQLLLLAALYPDLRRQDAASARLYHLRRHTGRRHHPRRLLGRCWALFGPEQAAHAADADHRLAVFARRVSGILADGRLSLARDRDIRRRLPQPDQGGLQRRLAVGAVGAVSSRDARRRSGVQLQRIGDDLRRIRPVYGDVADCADRRSDVARLLLDGHRSAQHHRADGDGAAGPANGRNRPRQ